MDTHIDTKIERIEIRVTANTKALLIAAAQARHTSVSDFLLTNGIAAAEQAVAMPKVFYAGSDAWDKIQRLLDQDEHPPSAEIAWLTQKPLTP